MQEELAGLMSTVGYGVEIRDRSHSGSPETTARLVVLDLKGTCSANTRGERQHGMVSLATTAVVDGHVLPFTSLNCEAVAQLLAPALVRQDSRDNDFIFGRSLARIMAHELYHILTGEVGHAHAGVAKESFTVADLLAGDFEFEGAALAKLRQPAELVADADEAQKKGTGSPAPSSYDTSYETR